MNLKIRTATANDAHNLSKIGWQSFHETFADHPANHPDDMKIYMDEAFSIESINRYLTDENTVFFVAELEDEMVGYAMLIKNARETGIRGEKPLELNRLYALKKAIGKGVGKGLILRCLEFAKSNNFDNFWLGVWEHNYRAQEFYKKFGFEKCGEHIFQLGNDPQTDWLMQKKI
jgi:diamine N-acetyltransferase